MKLENALIKDDGTKEGPECIATWLSFSNVSLRYHTV